MKHQRGSAEETDENPVYRKRSKNLQAIQFPLLSDDTTEASSAKITNPAKSESNQRLINEGLSRHVIFSSLAEASSESVVAAMKLYRFNSGGEVVFEQGSPGNNFYIIASGRVEVLINRRRVKLLKSGDSFGELALLQNLPRSATVKTVEPCFMWVIDRTAFSEALKLAHSATYEENKEFIEGVEVFKALTKSQRDALISSLITQKYEAGDFIVKAGEEGELLFIIKEGVVSCVIEGSEIRRLQRGDYFGEQALLYSCTRTASCLAVDKVKCLSITRADLTRALGSSLQKIIYRNSLRIAFSKSESLCHLSTAQQERIIDRMVITTYPIGGTVIESGTKMGRKLWVVVKGELMTGGSTQTFAGLYTAVGDQEILENERHSYHVDIMAKVETDIAEISRDDIERVIGGTLQTANSSNALATILAQAELFKGLSQENLQSLSALMTLRTYRNFEVIFEQGSRDSSFYIVNEGSVDIVRDGAKLKSIPVHECFGESSILLNELQSVSAVAKGNVSCWVLSRESLMSVVSQQVIEYLASRVQLQDDNVNLADLAPVQLIGKGNFGTVVLVVHKRRRHLYALKAIPRWKVVSYDLYQCVISEKDVLGQLDHMFILKLIKTLKDSTHLYYLTEFIKGMDLFDVLRKLGLVTDEAAKFYIASLAIALEHLHERSIVYRDLKPENVLVDPQGYIKVVDFGTAKIIQGRTYTVVGTPHYMAPEVILGKGYDYSADFWTLGVMLYEFMSGMLPFGDELRSPFEVYEAIIASRIEYPQYIKRPFPSQPVIEQLLSRNPAARLGGGIGKFKRHRWFRGFSWERLANKDLPAPYLPDVPDYSAKVTAALIKPQSIAEFLAREERDDDKSNMKRRAELPNWDKGF
jgi:cGMP-dependent protein kinase